MSCSSPHGIAFNLILAALPFILLLVAGVTLLLPILYRGTIVLAASRC